MGRILVFFAIAMLFSGAMAIESSSQEAPGPSQARPQALSTIRLINTAEVYFHRSAGAYGTFADLVSKGTLKETAGLNPDLGSAYGRLALQDQTEPLRDFDLALVVAADGKSYKLSVLEKKRCGMAFFTDDSGIIYQGKALGCAT